MPEVPPNSKAKVCSWFMCYFGRLHNPLPVSFSKTFWSYECEFTEPSPAISKLLSGCLESSGFAECTGPPSYLAVLRMQHLPPHLHFVWSNKNYKAVSHALQLSRTPSLKLPVPGDVVRRLFMVMTFMKVDSYCR